MSSGCVITGVIRYLSGPGCRKPVVELKKVLLYDYEKALSGWDECMWGVATLVHAVFLYTRANNCEVLPRKIEGDTTGDIKPFWNDG